MVKFDGCYTAIVTPMTIERNIDFEALEQLVEFQAENNVNGILANGTTGESATLTLNEQKQLINKVAEKLGKQGLTIAGTGSNYTEKTMEATEFANENNLDAVLLVDPYYNGPSSIEIRKEYLSPIATKFPELQIIPYIIPGRSGTQLQPEDLAILNSEFENIQTVKEATGNIDNMKAIRHLCGAEFNILSGDDGKTFEMITSSEIRASGVISVISNVVPYAVQELVNSLLGNKLQQARELAASLEPLFNIVTVKTEEESSFGSILCRARNPVPIKTLMNILGMINSPCRRPLGKMTRKGIETVLSAIRSVYNSSPKILEPIESFFDVDLSQRLFEPRFWEELTYG
jgi:4-hydroxy-tetrahydrodipicolinate synthase